MIYEPLDGDIFHVSYLHIQQGRVFNEDGSTPVVVLVMKDVEGQTIHATLQMRMVEQMNPLLQQCLEKANEI